MNTRPWNKMKHVDASSAADSGGRWNAGGRALPFAFLLALLVFLTGPMATAGEPPDDETLKSLMDAALIDEYRAEATYKAVMEDHGEIRPFSNIVDAEKRHADFLLPLYAERNWEPPTNPFSEDAADDADDAADEGERSETPRFDTVLAACEAAVQGEIDNVAIYEEAMEKYDLPDDVEQVFTRLMEASRDRHLKAFQRCVDRGGKPGRGQGGKGKGRGRGW